MKKNIVFMGNFSYPVGMADAKRIQRFVDFLIENGSIAKIMLLRQGGEVGGDGKIHKATNGVLYKTIGGNIKADLKSLLLLPSYFISGLVLLIKWKANDCENILYVYHGVTLENVLFVLYGKLVGYSIVFDIVENGKFQQEHLHLMGRIKWLVGEKIQHYVKSLADGIVVISSHLKNVYIEIVGSKIPVVLIPISAECPNGAISKDSGGPTKIVYSGSFAVKDGVEVLIEAFERVYEENQDCILLLTGKGANLPGIQERISNCKAIKYVGYLEEDRFYKFLQKADILCITRVGSMYANAGFPFKLGEYLATGNPVIASNVGDINIYLENMKDALIVEPGSVSAVVEAINYCIDNKEEAKRIGENGKRQCERHFNPKVNGKKLMDLLDVIVDKNYAKTNILRNRE